MGAKVDALAAEFFDKEIEGYSIDSRSVEAGELFFALSQKDYDRAGFNGQFADGHQFVSGALAQGALAAVVRIDHMDEEAVRLCAGRLLAVDDAIAALQDLAREVYESWAGPVVGITGSAGKTTAKELTAHVLQKSGRRVLKSERNYNNGLGLPLTVLRMVSAGSSPDDFDVAVLEMGMSSPTHEIRRLVQITPPDIAVELMVAPVHLEHLGTIENIAAAKAELIEGLKPGGTAVLNADDELVMNMRGLHAGSTITFGISNPADVRASEIEMGQLGSIRFLLQTPMGTARAELLMSGRHNLMNALAAAAVATCFNIEPEAVAGALRTVTPPRMRGEVLEFEAGFTVIDDSYNSNPRSLLSMVRTIADVEQEGRRRIVIAGEMLELGENAGALHREAGQEIAACGIETLWGVRGLAQQILEGASEAGLNQTRFFDSSEAAAAAIIEEVRDGDLVLVKGSRGVETDKVVKALKERFSLKS
jgi:UDP-N-acetylmuramoyl-tripeptide--D-alanyl-D-alanine ligase